MGTILEISDIRKGFSAGYGRGRRSVNDYRNVINGLNLELERGGVTALVGGNGVGKTTLFNLISGLLRPEQGGIRFYNGGKMIDCTLARPWNIAAAGIGRMFQGSRVYGPLSVVDHLLIQAQPAGAETPFSNVFFPMKNLRLKRELIRRIRHELAPFDGFNDLLDLGEKTAGSLSYARQRLLSLAGLLVGGYDLLLLDEPSSGLGRESFDMLHKLLEKIKEDGKTVFLIEHNMDFVRRSADICHYMAEGRILFSGTAEYVLTHEEVKRSYLL